MNIKIAIGADHRGFLFKQALVVQSQLGDCTVEWIDCGAHNEERSDYPVFAKIVSQKIVEGSADVGVLLCGTGIGMGIAANRCKGIRAGLAWNSEIARLAKEDDNCNVLVIPADYVSEQELVATVSAWLSAEFKVGRYAERLAMIDG